MQEKPLQFVAKSKIIFSTVSIRVFVKTLFPVFALIFLCSACAPSRSYFTFSKEDYYQVIKNPQKYDGQLMAFQGRVIDIQENHHQTLLKIIVQNRLDDFDGKFLTAVFEGNTDTLYDHEINILGYFFSETNRYQLVAIAISNKTLNYDWFLEKYKIKYEKWKSGELFNPEK